MNIDRLLTALLVMAMLCLAGIFGILVYYANGGTL